MKYARVEVDGCPRVGSVLENREDRAGAVSMQIRLFPSGTDLIATAVARAEPAADAPLLSLEEVRLLPPVHPASFRDFVAFEEHVQGAATMLPDPAAVVAAWYEAPTFLFGNPHAMIATGDPVAAPAESKALDFELEVGVVIGGDGRDVTPEQASALIAGYLIVNDWSARDVQRREMRGGLGPAKSKDFATTIGPWLVTPDELEEEFIGDRLDLRMSVSINGVEFGADSLAHMGWSFPELISYASRSSWIRAGDLIATGTCGGGALAEVWGKTGRQEPSPLQPGDVVTMTVEGLGSITNTVIAAAPEAWPITRATPVDTLKAATGSVR